MVYIHDKPLLLVCDNTVYVKMLEELGPIFWGGRRAAFRMTGRRSIIFWISKTLRFAGR